MRHALELARKGAEAGDGGPFGAVIVKGGEIVGEGWNQGVSHNDPTAHGEVVAIRDACKRAKTSSLQGCDLYTSGEPCSMCLSAIYWARLDRVFYGFSIQDVADLGFHQQHYIYEELAKKIDKRKIPEIQILGPEAVTLLKTYSIGPKWGKH